MMSLTTPKPNHSACSMGLGCAVNPSVIVQEYMDYYLYNAGFA